MNDLTEEQLNVFLEAFQIMDKNKDGFISADELKDLMISIGYFPTDVELNIMINKIDTNRNGKIEFEEFVNMMLKKLSKSEYERELRNAFNVIDKDRNGFISHNELKIAMNNLGQNLTDNEISLMIKEADYDNDGQLNYEEFEKFMNS